jgi:hypothetical protein
MSNKASFDLLESLHNAVATELLQKVQSGEATAAELSAAIKFLKDNGVEAMPVGDNPISKLFHALPFEDADIQQVLTKQ